VIFPVALLRLFVGRAGVGVGVRDRPAEPTAKRPEVLNVDAARRMLFKAEKKLSRCSSGWW
jgi:hypothetical protein